MKTTQVFMRLFLFTQVILQRKRILLNPFALSTYIIFDSFTCEFEVSDSAGNSCL